MRTRLCAVLAALVLVPAPAAPAAPQVSLLIAELSALEEFERRVGEYVALHRRFEHPLPAAASAREFTAVHADMAALARRVTAARPRAAQGDIITPAVARVFRRRIAGCLPPEAWAALLEEHAEHLPPGLTLRANVSWPDDAPFNFVPPELLRALPRLPPELQYRILGRSLVLWDHHANLVVDFLPGAITT